MAAWSKGRCTASRAWAWAYWESSCGRVGRLVPVRPRAIRAGVSWRSGSQGFSALASGRCLSFIGISSGQLRQGLAERRR